MASSYPASTAQITKRLRTPRADVDAALVAAGSEVARKALDRFDFLTLDQAATVAEFQDDRETVKRLVTAANTGQFDHVAARARHDRDEADRIEQFTQALRDTGLTLVEDGTRLNDLGRRCRPSAQPRSRV